MVLIELIVEVVLIVVVIVVFTFDNGCGQHCLLVWKAGLRDVEKLTSRVPNYEILFEAGFVEAGPARCGFDLSVWDVGFHLDGEGGGYELPSCGYRTAENLW